MGCNSVYVTGLTVNINPVKHTMNPYSESYPLLPRYCLSLLIVVQLYLKHLALFILFCFFSLIGLKYQLYSRKTMTGIALSGLNPETRAVIIICTT